MDFRDKLKKPLLFDGGMGTYYAKKFPEDRCELANLTHPNEIAAIHEAYLRAGCQAVKTNTFTMSGDLAQKQDDLAKRIIQAACRLATQEAEPYGALVFGDIGPAPAERDGGRADIYIRQAELFLDQGIRCFLVETLPADEGIPDLAHYLKTHCPDSFLLVSFAVAFDGITQEGYTGKELLQRMSRVEEIDAVGFNCVSGPRHLLEYIRTLDTNGKLLSVMPNAGYPTVLGRRTVFQGTPEYFGRKLAEIVQAGAAIVGGCCGTTPAHIAQAAQELAKPPHTIFAARPQAVSEPCTATQSNPFAEKLNHGQRVIAAELDSPADDDSAFYMEGGPSERRGRRHHTGR